MVRKKLYFVNDQIEERLKTKNKRIFLMTKIAVAFILLGFVLGVYCAYQLVEKNSFINQIGNEKTILYFFYGIFALWSNERIYRIKNYLLTTLIGRFGYTCVI